MQIFSLLFLVAVPVLNWLGVHWILGTLYSISIGELDIADPVMALQTKKLTAEGIIDRQEAEGQFYSDPVLNGWDEKPEELMYYAWHHEGRRFRHGAEMMGADFTQWHGIWELQEDMNELLTWAAEHGDAEAQAWVESNHPSKWVPFALYDMPGNAWGINVLANTTPFVYNTYPDYWLRIYATLRPHSKPDCCLRLNGITGRSATKTKSIISAPSTRPTRSGRSTTNATSATPRPSKSKRWSLSCPGSRSGRQEVKRISRTNLKLVLPRGFEILVYLK